MSDARGPDRRTAVDGRRERARRPRLAGIPRNATLSEPRAARFRGLSAGRGRPARLRDSSATCVRFSVFRGVCDAEKVFVSALTFFRFPTFFRVSSSDYYSSQPPPEEEGSIWGWLTGADDEPSNRGAAYSDGGGGYVGAAR